MTFSRRTEAVDAGADGLWLIGPSADEDLVLVVPATTTKLWRLVTTMLPTQEETVAILAACRSHTNDRSP
jgi:2-methylisocitrate lyase-like PEP mutase family enzyme